jgi:hypothetical protein
MFRKIIINASSNLKRGLNLGTKIKSNEWLNIGTEGVIIKKKKKLKFRVVKEYYRFSPVTLFFRFIE